MENTMWGRRILLLSFALIALGIATKCPKKRMSPVREILCYTSTFDVQLIADSVCSCTTLVHQNHDVRNFSISDVVDLRKSLKEMYPPLQFVISINDPAKTLTTSAMVRQEAIARIIAVMKEMDGVEMNVTAGSKERLYNFVKSLKDEMTRKTYDKRIFLALPSKAENIAKQFDLKELIKYVDLFTLPTDYLTDEDGAFVTFHPSRLMGLFDMLNTDNLVDLISGLGVPKQKILMTLPANAYKFTLKNETENAPRSETTEKEPTPIDRKQLCEAINNGEWIVERDEDLTAPYAFQNKTWIAFEDKISVGIKGKYALLRDLAGLAVRNIENDTKTECEEPLTQEIYHSFTEFKRKSRQAVLNALEDELHQMQFSYPNQAKTSSFRVVRVVDTEGHIRAVRESTQTEFVCRRQGYFVHPKSCNRFYRCVKFNQAVEDYSVFEFDCPAGLSFDERTEVCVWPGSLPQGSPCPGSSEIAPVVPKRFECSQPGYYADPQNCRWFFACMDLGESELMAFEFRCPYGLVFDEKKLVCEWPWLVPACSESGSAYTRTEYNYGGFTGTAGVGGNVIGSVPQYSVTAGTDYSKTTGAEVSYFGSTTGHFGERTGTSTSGTGVSRHTGLSGATGIDYSKSYESYHGGSSIPTYTGSSGIHVSSVSPSTINVAQGSTGYSASSNIIGGAGHTVFSGRPGTEYSISTDRINTEYTNTGSFGGITTGFSGSTAGQFSGTVRGNHVGQGGITYSRTPEFSYSRIPGSSFGSTGSSTDVRVGSTSPKYVGSANVYTDSTTFNAGSYSTFTDAYSGATGRQPTHSETRPLFETVSESSHPGSIGSVGITGSINRGYTESTANVYGGSFGTGYSKTPGGISAGSTGIDINLSSHGIESNLQSSTGSNRVPGPSFTSGFSKSGLVTSGISGHTGVTSTDNSHFVSGNIPYSVGTSSTRTRYNEDEGYTIPVFIHQDESIYASMGTTGVRSHVGINGVTSSYEKTDVTRPHLNVSIFGYKSPTGYDIQRGTTGTIITGSSVEGNIFTSDSSSGTVFSHENIPGAISTPALNQGTVLTGGVQPGYVATSSGTPGYVSRDRVKTVDVGSASPGTLIYGTPTPAVSLTGPATSGVILKDNITPGVVVSGQTAPGVSIGGSIQSEIVDSSTGKAYSQGTTYHDTRGNNVATSVTYSSGISSGGLTPTSFQSYKPDEGRGTVTFDTACNTENDIPDYRPTSATFPDSIVPGKIDSSGGVIFGSTLAQGAQSSTTAPEYFSTKSAVFTPSGFTKTGPTRTGITTAILGGGGSYSVSTSERRPILNPENISEKAFEGNVAGYTKTSFTSTPTGSTSAPGRVSLESVTPGYSYPKPNVQFETSDVTFSSTPIPSIDANLPVSTAAPGGRVNLESATPGYLYPKPNVQFEAGSVSLSSVPISSTDANLPVSIASGGRVSLESVTPGYSYPKPTVQFKTSGVTFSSTPTSPTQYNLPVTTPTPFLINVQNITLDSNSVFGSKAPTIRPAIYTTESPEIYETTFFEAAKIPTIKPVDASYKTIIAPTNIPVSVLTDDRFTQRTGGSQTASVSTSTINTLNVPFQRTDSGSQKDHGSFTSPSPVSGYLPAKSTGRPGVIVSTTKYDVPAATARPQLVGITYKQPSSVSDVTYKSPPSVISPTTFRPSNVYYSSQGFSTPSALGTTSSGGSPTNLDISRDKIDKLITNYRGTVKYTPNAYDAFVNSGYHTTSTKIFSSSSKSPVQTGSTFAITAPSGSTSSYEVTTKSPEGKGKVIVKWSDLHPILLGKLGAECTCKADPFATLRGPGKNLITSSRGKVDLANYDSSEIYVDLDNSSEEDDYTGYIDSSQPYKISPHETTTDSGNLPSNSYLPSRRDFVSAIDTRTGTIARSDTLRGSSGFRINLRTSKKLKDDDPSPNSVASSEEDDPDQIINGATDCARPGLFRHPSLCNKFYACHWDQWKKKFTLHIFNCPVHLTFDSKESACNWPSKGPACQAGNLLV